MKKHPGAYSSTTIMPLLIQGFSVSKCIFMNLKTFTGFKSVENYGNNKESRQNSWYFYEET